MEVGVEEEEGSDLPEGAPSETAAVACERASTTWSLALVSSSAMASERLRKRASREPSQPSPTSARPSSRGLDSVNRLLSGISSLLHSLTVYREYC